MEKHHLMKLIRRWGWLFILSAVVAGAAAYLITSGQPVMYKSSARLIVGPGIESTSPDLNDLRAGGQLMQTYAELPTTGPFLQQVAAELDFEVDIIALREMITTHANQETQILTIEVRAPHSREALLIANAVARTLVNVSPSGRETEAAVMTRRMRQQVEQLEAVLVEIQSRVENLEGEVQSTSDPTERRALIELLSRERDRLTDTHDTLADLYGRLQASTTNRIEILEPAIVAEPELTGRWLQVVLGAISGFVLSVAMALAYEYLADTIDHPRDLLEDVDIPALGSLPRHSRLSGAGRKRLLVTALPGSKAAETYRTLGIKLLFAGNGQRPFRSILLSSIEPNGDVGEIAANLAVVLAQTGSRVALVDANLHRPGVGQYFGIRNRSGLTDVLVGRSETADPTPISWAPGLSVLPSGSVSGDSFALLASPRMVSVIGRLLDRTDIVLVAAPPLLSFASSLFLASRVDGVILHAEAGKTRRTVLKEAVSSLQAVDACLVGAILHGNRSNVVHPAAPTLEPKPRSAAARPFMEDEQTVSTQMLAAAVDSLTTTRRGERKG